jgi:chemotaxis protein CheD
MKRDLVSTVMTRTSMASPEPPALVSVAIGQWALAAAPTKIQTLLGSCVGVVLYHRAARLGGVAHIVLPKAPGNVDHPGKYADTAIPALIADFDRRLGQNSRQRLFAKLAGGASMFQVESTILENSQLNIGQRNQETIERILGELAIPILARDLGGNFGRRLILDTVSGNVTIKVPGGADREI